MLALAFVLGLDAPKAHAALTGDMVSKAVSVFFKEAPVMVEVARCESELRQYDESGTVLRGGWGGKMIGLFQLHETYHRTEARARGYNIDTLIGNMGYARDLYREEGTTPWDSSASCWRRASVTVVSPTTPDRTTKSLAGTVEGEGTTRAIAPLTKTLTYGMKDAEVRLLQSALNTAGYQVTIPGEETEYFGVSTYTALMRFQCDHALACKTRPDTMRTIGRVDASTRAVINRQIGTMS